MPFPLALAYAREGIPVRRLIWDDDTHELAWIVYLGALYYYVNSADQDVVQAEDLDEDDFRAADWTTLAPGCVDDASCACGENSPIDPADPELSCAYPPWIGDEPAPFDVEHPPCCTVSASQAAAATGAGAFNQTQSAHFNNPLSNQQSTNVFNFSLPRIEGTRTFTAVIRASGDGISVEFTRTVEITYTAATGEFSLGNVTGPASKSEVASASGISCTATVGNSELSATGNGVRFSVTTRYTCSTWDGPVSVTLSAPAIAGTATDGSGSSTNGGSCLPPCGPLQSIESREAPELTLELTIDDASCVPAGTIAARTFSGTVTLAEDPSGISGEEYVITVRAQNQILHYHNEMEAGDEDTLTNIGPLAGIAGQVIPVEAEAWLPGPNLRAFHRILVTFPAVCGGS